MFIITEQKVWRWGARLRLQQIRRQTIYIVYIILEKKNKHSYYVKEGLLTQEKPLVATPPGLMRQEGKDRQGHTPMVDAVAQGGTRASFSSPPMCGHCRAPAQPSAHWPCWCDSSDLVAGCHAIPEGGGGEGFISVYVSLMGGVCV